MFTEDNVKFIVNDVVSRVSHDKSNITNEQILDIMALSIYESIEKFADNFMSDLRRASHSKI
jgi:hypothetical protein